MHRKDLLVSYKSHVSEPFYCKDDFQNKDDKFYSYKYDILLPQSLSSRPADIDDDAWKKITSVYKVRTAWLKERLFLLLHIALNVQGVDEIDLFIGGLAEKPTGMYRKASLYQFYNLISKRYSLISKHVFNALDEIYW